MRNPDKPRSRSRNTPGSRTARPCASLALSLLLLAPNTQAQTSTIKVALTVEHWEFQPQKAEFLDHKSRPAMKILPGAGPVVLKAQDFTDGTIEFDLEPLDPRFANFYFRWQDAAENECFYFRTARAGDPAARDAVQYAPTLRGINTWDLLGHFQTNASLRKQEWNHVKLVVSGAQMRAYVNSDTQPCLAITALEGSVTHGRLAFEGEAIVSNLIIKPGATEDLSPMAGRDPTEDDPRYLRQWQLSPAIVIPKGIDFAYDSIPKADTGWTPIAAERRGLINLPLGAGDNESLIGVANDFYGWGIVARLDSLQGVTLARP
jgi:hypothetical protein